VTQKQSGAHFTPEAVVRSLLSWVLRDPEDRLLDPSCGDGRFLAGRSNVVGIEQDPISARLAIQRAPLAHVHEGDFFSWAAETTERFDCASGNPPFIRFQTFKGAARAAAESLCKLQGVHFSGLASSWAPFLVVTAGLLKKGGRMAFVVPAEIGHAHYAIPLLHYLIGKFSRVQIVAVREKMFSDLSEDCWLLHAEEFGGSTSEIRFSAVDRFLPCDSPPTTYESVAVSEWQEKWDHRLRPYLINSDVRALYRSVIDHPNHVRFGQIASIGVGYVSGANDFFHLRPSEAAHWDIPSKYLHPTVRNGGALPAHRITMGLVEKWKEADEPILLLRLPKTDSLPRSVSRYLDTRAGHIARQSYKCRVRQPWYSVPEVRIPNYFLSYMSGKKARFVRNEATCTFTNSILGVRLRCGSTSSYLSSWDSTLVQLSIEIEGHPLGGGLLKLEPREAARIVLRKGPVHREPREGLFTEALHTMRRWRHLKDLA
jgi:adenine-specific DNA methylase